MDYGFWTRYPMIKGDLFYPNLQPLKRGFELSIFDELEKVKTENPYREVRNTATNIYLMIDHNTGYYKIGRSMNPAIREKTLQSEKPTIELIFSYEGCFNDERYMHEYFSDKRIRGEWFDLTGSDIIKFKQYFTDREAFNQAIKDNELNELAIEEQRSIRKSA